MTFERRPKRGQPCGPSPYPKRESPAEARSEQEPNSE